MNEFIEEHGKNLFWIIGLIMPLVIVLVQMAIGFDNSPLTILMFAWFGIALFIYIGVYEKDNGA